MPFNVVITEDAQRQLRSLTAREQRMVEDAVLAKLILEPATPTQSVKRLRPNPLAEYELRVGELRVLYNIEESEIVVLIVGRKVGNKLIVEGEEFHGHQDDPSQQPGSESKGNAE